MDGTVEDSVLILSKRLLELESRGTDVDRKARYLVAQHVKDQQILKSETEARAILEDVRKDLIRTNSANASFDIQHAFSYAPSDRTIVEHLKKRVNKKKFQQCFFFEIDNIFLYRPDIVKNVLSNNVYFFTCPMGLNECNEDFKSLCIPKEWKKKRGYRAAITGGAPNNAEIAMKREYRMNNWTLVLYRLTSGPEVIDGEVGWAVAHLKEMELKPGRSIVVP